MALHIDRINAIAMDFFYILPNQKSAIGIEISQGGYGYEEQEEVYVFPSGATTDALLITNNNVFNIGLAYRYDLKTQGAFIPYLQARTGVSTFKSDIALQDRNEFITSSCPKPLEEEVLSSDAALYLGAGVGARLDLQTIFKKLKQDVLFLDFSVSYNYGTNIAYMSLNNPQRNLNTGSEVENINIQFASEAEPDIILEQDAGDIYSNPLQLVDFKIGLGINIPKTE
ncbi:MAG: hypothetical protein ACFB0B_23045 [Thermonemataceae bacterium]